MRRKKNRNIIYLTILLLSFQTSVFAQSFPIPDPPIIGAKSYLLIDSVTGKELAAYEPDMILAPASLTKLMTAYVIFNALQQEQITLEDEVTVSEKAWRTEGSRMFIEVGKKILVNDLILGMIVQSGNDASVALAEHVAGTESLFAEIMNQFAFSLGMHSTKFSNSTGLPHENHYTTARDLSILTRAIINEFPDYYRWYSIKEFQHNGILQKNRNTLLWRDPSVDGMKTGLTDEAGYCLVSSASREGMRIISIVMGTATERARTDGSQALLNYGFRFYETKLIYQAQKKISDIRIWKSQKEITELGIAEDLYLTIPRGSSDEIELIKEIPSLFAGNVEKGQEIGKLKISLDEKIIATLPLEALEENPYGSLWQRLRDTIQLWFENE
jgi:D-alanyl-D-alanine carboxypeptidase (penicillin-binding protein 5/6)